MTINLFQDKTIKLSAVRETDAKEMAKWQEDSEYLRNVDTDLACPQSLHEISNDGLFKGRRSNSISFMLRTVQDERLIGFVAIHGIEWNNRTGLLAIGIGDANDRGKGYGREAIQLILKYAFYELNLHRIGLDVISYNKSAIALYKKMGFQMEGCMREAVQRDGKCFDRIIMGILRDEWIELQN
ncbi:GNAT family N-acetyltransferase [Bacillus cereus]|uniref:GNAT family N-acetyltransferase n=1 Tax=Bacillus cereus TaxID=1396 RepID=A0A2C0EH03_BACCE|nr:GNAT family protein [Bacillus cereus]PDY78981.1 GNAT family N-acetyltransferase [Bacillus cereus]PFA12390.1 GNAT family N-acetyltransferase [Bacillus cereus]PFM35157.1 GNAT family N-acetyltransferase [Bacillus cereus]PGL63109.1 GNAT family N-acetyltransferase [Bacillus cereus]PGQ05705.1 GNAT family N-acetyltransferase [Bacillus cereus]